MATSKLLTCSTGNLKYRQDFFFHGGDIPAGYPGSASAELHFSMPFRRFQDKTHRPVYMISDTTIGMSKSLYFGLEKEEMSKAKEMHFLECRRNVG